MTSYRDGAVSWLRLVDDAQRLLALPANHAEYPFGYHEARRLPALHDCAVRLETALTEAVAAIEDPSTDPEDIAEIERLVVDMKTALEPLLDRLRIMQEAAGLEPAPPSGILAKISRMAGRGAGEVIDGINELRGPDSGTVIHSVRARALDVAMKKAFGIAGGAQTAARNVLVEITLGSGVTGYGEAAPFPAFNGETQEQALAACGRAATELVGKDLAALVKKASRIESASASAACAIETALVDAHTKTLGVPLHAWLGGREESLVTDITITTGTVEEAAREARAFALFETLKIKVGGGDVDWDVARVNAVFEARPDARLILDANGGLSVADAIRLARELRARGIVPALFEQPVAAGSWEALAEVRAQTGLRVAADESITCVADVDAALGNVDFVNVKIMKSGFFEAVRIARRAKPQALGLMVGGMVETRLAHGASACLAAGIGGFAFVDLDTPLFLASDPFIGGYAQEGPRIDLTPVTLGHGATPR